jgi:hypothetical protein
MRQNWLPAYIVASSQHRCWRCNGEIAVHALAAAPPFDQLDGSEQWRRGARLAVQSYVENLQERTIVHLKPYWMSHCEYCGAKIGDYETVETVGAPFDVRMLGLSDVKLLDVSEPL